MFSCHHKKNGPKPAQATNVGLVAGMNASGTVSRGIIRITVIAGRLDLARNEDFRGVSSAFVLLRGNCLRAMCAYP